VTCSFFNDMIFANNKHFHHNSRNKSRDSFYFSRKYANRIYCLMKIVVLRMI